MTLTEIYAEFNPGGPGFVDAVKTHCGFEVSDTEAKRLGQVCDTANSFEFTWRNDDWWLDGQR